jgi:hypothetical protein
MFQSLPELRFVRTITFTQPLDLFVESLDLIPDRLRLRREIAKASEFFFQTLFVRDRGLSIRSPPHAPWKRSPRASFEYFWSARTEARADSTFARLSRSFSRSFRSRSSSFSRSSAA